MGVVKAHIDSLCRRRFRAAAQAICRPTLRPHDLHQTAASLFVASRIQLLRVARVLGRGDTGMTYLGSALLSPDNVTARIDRLDANIAPSFATEFGPIPLSADD